MNVDLDAIRSVINPPERIGSLEHLEELIQSDTCHSVVEQTFYDELVPIFADLRERSVPGDLLAAGVWKGGSSLYLHAVNHHFRLGRKLWLFDTFSGFVQETISHAKDREALRMFTEDLKFSARFPTPADVERLFRSCQLWDGNVTIAEGPLETTIAAAPVTSLALIHVDVDFYEPTRAALELTYDKLSPGGYVIIDDYGVEMFNCKDAVDEFRQTNGIHEPLHVMTDYIHYWQKTSSV